MTTLQSILICFAVELVLCFEQLQRRPWPGRKCTISVGLNVINIQFAASNMSLQLATAVNAFVIE